MAESPSRSHSARASDSTLVFQAAGGSGLCTCGRRRQWPTNISVRQMPAEATTNSHMTARSSPSIECFQCVSFLTMPTGTQEWPASGQHGLRVWWAHQDSNLEPRDSRDSAVSGSADYLFTLTAFRGGRVRDALACHQGRSPMHGSPQVVSAPSGGAPPAWLRIAAGQLQLKSAAAVSLNSSRSRPAITGRRHLSMSPLL